MKQKNVMNVDNYALIDLHLHLDGSLSLGSVKELAAMQNIQLPDSDEEILNRLQVSAGCRDLNEYLEKFDFPVSLLQTKEAITTAVCNLKRELKEQGLLYAEIRFAPQLHTRNGLPQEEVVQAAIEGMMKHDFRSGLILCCMRSNDNQEANMETVRVAGDYLGKGVCALDIAGAEALYPTELFEELFAYAQKLNIPYTIHAGEADGPSSVRKALEFGASRIGHGIRSVEDKGLLEMLAEKKVTLELCPTSNLNTNIFENMKQYPIRKLMEAGVKITINTDNMTVSNTCLREEFTKVVENFDLTKEELELFVKNSIDAAFADDKVKQWLQEQMEEC